MQKELLDYFIAQLESGDYSDLELMENLIDKALGLNSDPVIALRAATEIVRSSATTGNIPVDFGWGYETTSKFFYEHQTDYRLDDSGFGDLMDTGTPNQVAHTIGIAYIAAYMEKDRMGLLTYVLVMGNDMFDGKQTIIDRELGFIAVELGLGLATDQSEVVSHAVSQIESYTYGGPYSQWRNIRIPY